MRDALFGDVEYDFGWVGQCEWPFLGKVSVTRLMIPCDDGAEISEIQREAYSAFEQHKVEMCKAAEDAIFIYYRDNLADLRERFGRQFADQWAPEIAIAKDLSRLLVPSEVIVQEPFDSPDRIIGLMFDCAWEPSLGLAAKFVNERLSEVGTQDIVL